MNITVVLGTARSGRVSKRVADVLVNTFQDKKQSVTLVDVKKHVTSIATTPPWGEGGADSEPTEWKGIVSETDVFIMVLPEYNHSFSGEWKLLMDTLFKEYKDKHCYVVGVSRGSFAGARVIEHVMPVLVNFQFKIGTARLHIGNVQDVISEAGDISDETVAKRVEKFITHIIENHT